MPWRVVLTAAALIALVLLPGFAAICPASEPERTVLESVEFEAGSDVLKSSSTPALRELLQELQQHPDMAMVVEGHTAASGSEEYDLALARDRAQAVFDWLVANGGDPDRIQVVGYGSSRPRRVQPAGSSQTQGDDRLEIVKIQNLHPKAVVPETEFQFPAVVDGTDVVHDFKVFNRGKGVLKIHRVKTG